MAAVEKTDILVFDDTDDTKDLFDQVFRHQIKDGVYSFSYAKTVEDSLTLMKQKPFDIFLSDISVDGTDAIDLIRDLRKQYPVMKCVIISAYGDINTLRSLMRVGAHDFVIKPIDIDDLVDTIDKTAKYVARTKEIEKTNKKFAAISNELDVTAQLQRSMLPGNVIRNGSIDLWADTVPAAEVGGDFYDYFWLSDTKLGIVMADVSGKNVSAAMFAVMAKTLIKAFAKVYSSPAECFQKTNITLCGENTTTMFVTAMYGIVDIEKNELTYTNAGHLPIVSVLPGQEARFLECDAGMALGIWDETEFTDNVHKFSPGEMIMLYTDGVTEAAAVDGAEFDTKRLSSVVTENSKKNPQLVTKELVSAIKQFTTGAAQSDDITTLCLKYRYRVISHDN